MKTLVCAWNEVESHRRVLHRTVTLSKKTYFKRISLAMGSIGKGKEENEKGNSCSNPSKQ